MPLVHLIYEKYIYICIYIYILVGRLWWINNNRTITDTVIVITKNIYIYTFLFFFLFYRSKEQEKYGVEVRAMIDTRR